MPALILCLAAELAWCKPVAAQVAINTSADAVNVRREGAAADGLKDDTKVIQAAIDKASRLNLKVYFPCGTYLVGLTALRIMSSSTLLGAGPCAVIKEGPSLPDSDLWRKFKVTNQAKIVMTNKDWDAGDSHIVISNITFDLSQAPKGTSNAIVFNRVSFARVDRIIVIGNASSGGGAADGVAFISSHDYQMSGNSVNDVNNACYDNWGGSHNFLVRDNYCNGADVDSVSGILATGANTDYTENVTTDACIADNMIINVGAAGVWIQGGWNLQEGSAAKYGAVQRVTIVNNAIENVTKYHGIRISDASDVKIDSNLISKVSRSAIIALSEYRGVQRDITVTANTIMHCDTSHSSAGCIVFGRTTKGVRYAEGSESSAGGAELAIGQNPICSKQWQ